MASGSPLSVVFLDAGTVDLGDVDLAPLKRQGRLTFFPDTSPEEVLQRARGAQVLITNKCVLHGSVLDRLSDVKLVCVAATGTDNVDLKAAEERGIAVANVTDYSTPSGVDTPSFSSWPSPPGSWSNIKPPWTVFGAPPPISPSSIIPSPIWTGRPWASSD